MALHKVRVCEITILEVVEQIYGGWDKYLMTKLKDFTDKPERPKLEGKITASVEAFGTDHVRFTLEGLVEVPDVPAETHWNTEPPKNAKRGTDK